MVKIRLFRTGATKRPMYRIVAVDGRSKREGRVLELLGTYDPRKGDVQVKRTAIDTWVGRGAHLSDTVRSLLRKIEAADASTAS
jgi:small subunit ribosomal protein S16